MRHVYFLYVLILLVAIKKKKRKLNSEQTVAEASGEVPKSVNNSTNPLGSLLAGYDSDSS